MFLKEKILQELELRPELIFTIMKELGEEDYRTDSNGDYLFRTICHGGDSYKLHYFQEDRQFHCYTGCSCNYSIFDLVSKIKNIDFGESQRFIASVLNISNSYFVKGFKDNSSEQDWMIINKFKRLNQRPKEINIEKRNKNILNLYSKMYHHSWLDEGISLESMEKFNIRFDIFSNRIIIPHFNIDGDLVGIRARHLNQEDVDNGYKYLPVTIQGDLYSHETRYNLYGLNITKANIQRMKKIIIFESEKSLLKSDTIYGDNNFAVALGGSALTQFHRDLILSLGVEEVILALDRENFINPTTDKEIEKNENYTKKMLRLAMMFAPYVRTYIVYDDIGLTEYKDAPIDRGQEILEKLMKCKYEIKTESGDDIEK